MTVKPSDEVDIIALNTYPMWYTLTLDIAELEPVVYQKPHFVSEWGGGALAGPIRLRPVRRYRGAPSIARRG